MLTKWCHE